MDLNTLLATFGDLYDVASKNDNHVPQCIRRFHEGLSRPNLKSRYHKLYEHLILFLMFAGSISSSVVKSKLDFSTALQ